jgi:hypothetical protein
MRSRAGALYWVATGAVMGFGLIGLMTIGFPFVVVGLVMAVVGMWKPGIGGAWGFLIGFGGLPALVFLAHIIGGALTALNPYCSRDLHRGEIVLPPGEGSVSCSYIPASYYILLAISVTIALSGIVLYLLLRPRSRQGTTA